MRRSIGSPTPSTSTDGQTRRKRKAHKETDKPGENEKHTKRRTNQEKTKSAQRDGQKSKSTQRDGQKSKSTQRDGQKIKKKTQRKKNGIPTAAVAGADVAGPTVQSTVHINKFGFTCGIGPRCSHSNSRSPRQSR